MVTRLLVALLAVVGCRKGPQYGVPPATTVPPPTFEAVSHLGASRTVADLLGQPTVMWFFPAASSPF